MDYHPYTIEMVVRDHLTRLRADAARARLAAHARRRGAWRAALGNTLVRLGERRRAGGDARGLSPSPKP